MKAAATLSAAAGKHAHGARLVVRGDRAAPGVAAQPFHPGTPADEPARVDAVFDAHQERPGAHTGLDLTSHEAIAGGGKPPLHLCPISSAASTVNRSAADCSSTNSCPLRIKAE
jgi:hypothetical protein